MALRNLRPVANGLQTDHPVPDLPFVDDSHLPIEDPWALEAVGRHHSGDSWGRTDPLGDGTISFTTDQDHKDYAWVVRYDPERGRSVMVFRDEDASDVHMGFSDPGRALLFRAGDYWWDGQAWFRPPQVWDPASYEYVRRPVPGARTVSAADLLAGGPADPSRGRMWTLAELATELAARTRIDADDEAAGDEGGVPKLDAGPERTRWLDDLAAWAQRRDADALPLEESVVNLTAPELTGDQLVGVGQLAQIAGIAASTLRAYISRGEAEVPAPQAMIAGRAAWARPVAEEWAERRRLEVAASEPGPDGLPQMAPGLTEVRARFAKLFFSRLWENASTRKRWALRWRSQDAVREIATGLGWDVAANLRGVVPLQALASTTRHALLHEFMTGQRDDRAALKPGETETELYGIAPPVSAMLTWLLQHYPETGATVIAETIGEAERDLQIRRDVTADNLRTAVVFRNSQDTALHEVVDKALAPILENRP
jgi:hypothetical protein